MQPSGDTQGGPIYETSYVGFWIKVYPNRVDFKNGVGSQSIPINQIASIQTAMIGEMKITLVTTAGQGHSIPTTKKKEVKEAIYSAQSRLVGNESHNTGVIPGTQYPPQQQFYQPPVYQSSMSQSTFQAQKPPKKKMPWWSWVLIIAGIIALCGIANAISNSGASTVSTAPQTTATTDSSTSSQNAQQSTPTVDITTTPAYQMATIDAQGATPDAATIARYQKVLDSLHTKTGESEQQIADETVTGQGILQKNKYTGDMKLITLMNAVDSSITKKEHIKYSEALAALITLMEYGK